MAAAAVEANAGATGLLGMMRSNLRMSAEAELVGADYVHHGGSAFELTKTQIKLHNEMRAAQDRMVTLTLKSISARFTPATTVLTK